MCFQFGSLPDYRGGAIIAALSPGNEIVIKRGFGTPPADRDVVEIIASVDEMSALTNTGRMLACLDGYGIEATGKHFEEFEISPEAQMILEKVARQKAPEGKFRVLGVDTFDDTDWVEGDFDTLEEAIKVADEKGGTMTKMHVYDDQGRHRHEAGTF